MFIGWQITGRRVATGPNEGEDVLEKPWLDDDDDYVFADDADAPDKRWDDDDSEWDEDDEC